MHRRIGRFHQRPKYAEGLEPRVLLAALVDESVNNWFPTAESSAYLRDTAPTNNADRWIVRLNEAGLDRAATPAAAVELLNLGTSTFYAVHGLGTQGLILIESPYTTDFVSARLAFNAFVAEFTLDHEVAGQVEPNDPFFVDEKLIGLENNGSQGGTVDADIDAAAAWDITTGSRESVVAVIDTGVDYSHADLAGNIWINQGEIPTALRQSLFDLHGDGVITFEDLNRPENVAFVADVNANGFIDAGDLLAHDGPGGKPGPEAPVWVNGINEDGGGDPYIDDLVGWDFRNNDNDPFDDHGHGTHVTGTLGAVGNNDFGVVGVSWEAAILPIKYLSETNRGQSADAIMAVEYVTMLASRAQDAMNIRLINASWGSTQENFALAQAINSAGTEADVLMIAAAGNGNFFGSIDNDQQPFFPASFPLDNIVSVAASNQIDELARFSNFGPDSVDLAAPGVGIFSTHPGDQFTSRSGTSMATPHVTGTAALVLANSPAARSSEIKAVLLESVDPLDALSGITKAGGRLNAAKALQLDRFAPHASIVQADDLNVPSSNAHELVLEFTDETAVAHSSLTSSNVFVRRVGSPEAISLTLESVDKTDDDPRLVATYNVAPLGGIWDALDNDTYEIVHASGLTRDIEGNLSSESILGEFTVDIPPFEGLFIVDSTTDAGDLNLGDGNCADAIGDCTLRAAVMEANADADNNTIVLPAGLFELSIAGRDEQAAATGDLDIAGGSGSLTIIGAGVGETIIDAAGNDRLFHIAAGGELDLRDLELRNGDSGAGASGGALLNLGSLNLEGVVISGTTAGDAGGAIHSTGDLTISRSMFHDNEAVGEGGAIYAQSTLDVSRSSFHHNQSGGGGGAVAIRGTGASTIVNSTLSTNIASADGGGLLVGDMANVSIDFLTVTANQAVSGGGIAVEGGTLTISNTISAENSATADSDHDIAGAVTTAGYNLIGLIDTATGFDDKQGDQLGTPAEPISPSLKPLLISATTAVHQLEIDSPAIDTADPLTGLSVDQRGLIRPIDGDHNAVSAADIGAAERYYAEIRGTKYLDLDGDGLRDPGEEGLQGWTIFLDDNRNGVLDSGERSTTTDSDGEYRFDNLESTLTYTVAEVQQAGWEQTAPASGRRFSVSSTMDRFDALRGDGFVDDGNGNATLRAAIEETNALPGHDVIELAEGRFQLTISSTSDPNAVAGDLDIFDNLTIVGEGAGKTIIDAGGLFRVFRVHPGATLNLLDLTVTGGEGETFLGGGGVYNAGSLQTTNVVFEGNRASTGGAISNAAGSELEISRSTFRGNHADRGSGEGGAIAIDFEATAVIQRSTFHDNHAHGSGGGAIHTAGELIISNSTLSRNTASGLNGDGGGLHAASNSLVDITNVTITDNSATGTANGFGGGLYAAQGASLEVVNTIIANNTTVAAGPDAFADPGVITSLGHNLIGITDGSNSFATVGDQAGTTAAPLDPLLQPLGDYGGPTWTHRIVDGSPAIDAGDDSNAPPIDQRGVGRPQDGDENGTSIVDIGAFEYADRNLAPLLEPVVPASFLPARLAAEVNAGIAIGDLLSAASDLNPGDTLGVAIIGADFRGGLVQYSLDGGNAWFNVGQVRDNQALLLGNSANTRLRYQPNEDYLGTVFSAITFRAWDQTQGVEGQRIDATLGGGFTAFSAATDRWEVTVSESAGSDYPINETTLGNQRLGMPSSRSIERLTGGEYVAVWQTPGEGSDVSGRIFNADGTPVTGEFGIAETTSGDQEQPTVAALPGGGFAVSWYSDIVGGVAGRRFDSSGVPMSPEFTVNNSYLNNRLDPIIASSDLGYQAVGFSARSLGPQAWETVIQIYSPSGSEGELFQPYSRLGDEFVESIDWLTDDLLAVSYRVDELSDPGHVHLGLFDRDGNAVAEHIAVAPPVGAQGQSSLAANSAGLVITWVEETNSGTNVLARRFDATGTPLGTAFPVSVNTTGNQSAPTVDMAADGRFTIAFASDSFDSDGSSAIFARRFTATGTPIGDEFRVPATHLGPQQKPAISVAPDADFVIAWDGNGPGDDQGIFAHRFETNDAPRLAGWPVGDLLRQDIPEQDNMGVPISEFLFGVTDTDANALSGVALTAINESDGQVQYSTDGGNAWMDLQTLSEAGALLLADDPLNRIRFLPDHGFLGAVADAVTYRAWDQTEGLDGEVVGIGATGGDSAFSDRTSTFQFAFTNVFWDGGGDNVNWSDPLNWNGDAVPADGADVLIDINDSAALIEIHSNATTGAFHSVRKIGVQTASFNVTGQARLHERLFIDDGQRLLGDGAGSAIIATGSLSIDEGSIHAKNGSVVVLTEPTTYAGTNVVTEFHAFGTGSLLAIPALTSISGGTSTGYLDIRANDGGHIDLGGLQAISGGGTNLVTDPDSSVDVSNLESWTGSTTQSSTLWNDVDARQLRTTRYVDIVARGTIQILPSLEQYYGGNSSRNTLIRADGTDSELHFPALHTFQGNTGTALTTVLAENGGLVNLSQAFNITAGSTWFVSRDPQSFIDADGLVDWVDNIPNPPSKLDLSNGGLATFNSLESIDSVSIAVEEGQTFTLPALRTVTSRGHLPNDLYSIGVNSVLNLPALEQILGSASGQSIQFGAFEGGQTYAPNLHTISGAVETKSSLGDSILDLSGLQNWSGPPGNGPEGIAFAGEMRLGSGTVAVDDVRIAIGQGGLLTGGTLELDANSAIQGTGTVQADVVNNGTIILGDTDNVGPGRLTIDGDYTHGTGGFIDFEIDGLVPETDHDQLVVTGNADLAGSISVSFDGHTPQADERFGLIVYGTRTGEFSSVAGLDAAVPSVGYTVTGIDAFYIGFSDFYWDGEAGDNLWNSALNWSSDSLPTTTDYVVINNEANPIVLDSGVADIRGLSSSVALQVNGTAELRVNDASSISQPLSLGSGTLRAQGPNAEFVATDDVTLFGSSLFATGGAAISLRGATSHDGFGNHNIESHDPNSSIDLSGVTSLLGNSSGGTPRTIFRAFNGGRVDLSSLQSTTGLTRFEINNPTSDIVLDSLIEMTDGDLIASGGGALLLPQIQAIRRTDLSATSGATIDVSSASTYEGADRSPRLINVDGTDSLVDLSGLSTFTGSTGFICCTQNRARVRVEVSDGGTVDLSSVTTLEEQTRLRVVGNEAQILLPLVEDLGSTEVEVHSATFAFPLVESLQDVLAYAYNGGTVDFSAVTNYLGPLGDSDRFLADGAGSRIDLSTIGAFPGGVSFPDRTFVEAMNGGTIDLSSTTQIGPGPTEFNIFSGGVLDFGNQHVVAQSAGINSQSSINVDTLELGNSSTLLAAGTIAGSVINSGELSLTDPAAELTIAGSYAQTSTGSLNVNLEGANQGSEYDRINVGGSASLDGGLNVAVDGGFIPDPGVPFDIIGYASATGDFATISGLDTNATRPGFAFPRSTSFRLSFTDVFWDGDAGDFQWTTAANWSNDTLPGPGDDVLIEPAGGTISLGSGTVSLGSLISRENIEVTGVASLTLTDKSVIEADLTVTPNATLKVIGPEATLEVLNSVTIDGANLEASGGGLLDLSSATAYDSQFNVQNIVADGAGSRIDLSGLATVQGGIGQSCAQCPNSRLVNLIARDGGTIDLDSATSLDRQVVVQVIGTDSQLNAPLLSTIDGAVDGAGGGRIIVDDGQWQPPALETLRYVEMFAQNGALLDLSGVTTFVSDRAYPNVKATGVGSVLDLSGLTLYEAGVGQGCPQCTGYHNQIVAEAGGLVDLSGVQTMTGISQFLADGTGSRIDLTSMTDFQAGRSGLGLTAEIVAQNDGLIELTPATLTIERQFNLLNETGTVSVGVLQVADTVVDAKLQGTLNGSLTNHGEIGIGTVSKGELTVTGDYAQTSSGTLNVQLGEALFQVGDDDVFQSEHDTLTVQGTLSLDGTLAFSLLPGDFPPAVGNSYRIVNYIARSGSFATIAGASLQVGQYLMPDYATDNLTFTNEYFVFETVDAVDESPGDGTINDGTGRATLRAAIQEANSLPGTQTIYLGPGTFSLSLAGLDEDDAASGDLDITDDLVLIGKGSGLTTINANDLDRVFQLINAELTLEGITITGGDALTGFGGGILNDGRLTLRDVAVIDNSAAQGGGIYTGLSAEATIISSRVVNNTADHGGGLFVNAAGDLSLIDSTITQNISNGDGGGIYSTAGGMVEIERSLVAGNSADNGQGGGFYNTGSSTSATVMNSTFSGNSAASGGGIGNDGGPIMLDRVTIFDNNAVAEGGGFFNKSLGVVGIANSIIAGNNAPSGPDISRDPFNSWGHNLIGIDPGTLGFADGINNDLTGSVSVPLDPRLAALADNGGPTFTHLPLAGSPVIDAGPRLADGETDQRGAWRKIDGDLDGIVHSDIGATEYALFVDDFGDTVDANPGDGFVADANGNQTLRAAIMEANALAGHQTISLPVGTFGITRLGTAEDLAATGDFDILEDLTIIGDTAAPTVIEGNELDRLFQVLPDTELTIQHVTVRGGRPENNAGGGGIVSQGTVRILDSIVADNFAEDGVGLKMLQGSTAVIERSVFENNAADSGSGGGIHVYLNSTLRVEDSVFRANRSGTGNPGGAISVQVDGNAEIYRSLFQSNSASSTGGAIFSGGNVLVENSTFHGNSSATQHGGAFAVRHGTTRIINSTITNNIGGTNDRGGGIYQEQDGVVVIGNSVVAGNVASSDPDLSGQIRSLGNNLFGTTDGATISAHPLRSDLTGTIGAPLNPLLGPLQDNGGLTLTREPLEGSPLIDAGDDFLAPATDQRDVAREIDGNYDATGTSDIGAVEFDSRGFTVTVNTTADTVDVNPGDGIVADAGGMVSLRAAIMEANASAGQTGSQRMDTIILPAGDYLFDESGTGEDGGATGDLDILDHVIVIGAGAGSTTIDAGGLDRVIDVFSGVTAQFSGVTIRGGATSGFAPRVSSGGGIYNAGRLHLTDSEVVGNSSSSNGGGIHSFPGSETFLNRVTIANNSAREGGGIQNEGSLSLLNVTVSGNTATSAHGGGIYSSGDVDMAFSTVARNQVTHAFRTGEGLYNDAGTFVVRASLVAENGEAGEGDIAFNGQAFQSAGFNVIGADDSGSFTHAVNNDQVGVAAGPLIVSLTDLADFGGDVATHGFSTDQSPAINAGDPGDFPEIDARGVLRNTMVVAAPDVGAHEYVAGIQVNTFADTPDSDTTDGIASDADGNISLRAAVLQANADQTQETILLSEGTYRFTLQDIAPAGDADAPSVSADGRFIAFHSAAEGLVPGDTNGLRDVFVYDSVLDVVERISVAGDGSEATGGHSDNPSISTDGRYVTFQSQADNLVANDTNGKYDIFLYDRQLDSIERISVASDDGSANDHSRGPKISGDGRFVTFSSAATNVIPGIGGGFFHVYVYDRTLDTMELVSRTMAGEGGNSSSLNPDINHDGRWIVFRSVASDLVPGDANGLYDIYLFDNQTNEVTRISNAHGGGDPDRTSTNPAISADGSLIVYETEATNIFPSDASPANEIVLFDRGLGTPERISINNLGEEADADSHSPSISADGRYVVFTSEGDNFDAARQGMANHDVFVRDRVLGETHRFTAAEGNTTENDGTNVAVISADGTTLAFDSESSVLVSSDTNDSRDVFIAANTANPTYRRINLFEEAYRGDLDIRTELVIQGAGAGKTILDAAELDRVFEIAPSAGLTLSDLTITGGDAGPFDGGAILNHGSVFLERVEVTGNRTDGSGGAIHTGPSSSLFVLDSTLSANISTSATGGGGGISAEQTSQFDVARTTIYGNQATNGGGVFLTELPNGQFHSATITGNQATETGGGLLFFATDVVLQHSTVTANSAGLDAGGIASFFGLPLVGHTIVAGNVGPTADLVGDYITDGYNLIGNGSDSLGFTHNQNNDLVGTTGATLDPGLLPLADNGGPTRTHAITVSSLAYNAGDPAAAPSIDQRLYERVALGAADIGAFELQVIEAEVFDSPPGMKTDSDPKPGNRTSNQKRAFKHGSGETGASEPGNGVWIVEPPPAALITEIDFGNRPLPGSIGGVVYHDLNSSESRDFDEPPLEGWTIYLDLNQNGQLDGGEPSTLSTSDGSYLFTELDSHRSYRVVQLPEDDWDITSPPSGEYDVFLNAGETQSLLEFGNAQSSGASGGSISGVLFEDLDFDGRQDPGESGIAGEQVYIDLNDNEQFDPQEPVRTTDADGSYEFTQLGAGVYLIRAVEDDQLIQVSPISNVFTAAETVVGSDPQALASGDFFGNGRVDLIVANGGSNSVTLLQSNQDHVLESIGSIPLGNVPSDIVAGHFNNDGRLDFAVTHNQSNFVSIMLNDAGGAFSETRVPVTFGMISLTAVDVDNDGDLDLPVAGLYSGEIYFLENDGNGTFTHAPQNDLSVPPTNQGSPASLVVLQLNDDNGDLLANQDDRPDLAFVDLAQPAIHTAINNGDGSFQITSLAIAARALRLATGDYDGDGFTDIAATIPELDQVLVAYGDGNGMLGQIRTLQGSSTPAAITAADVDNDGDLDIVVSSLSETGFTLFRNQGDGTFASEVVGGSGSFPDSLAPAMITADLEGDGDQDFALANGSGSGEVTLLYNDLAGKSQLVSLVRQASATADLGAKLIASPSATVVARHLFYAESSFGETIAHDKEALLPGGTATFANYSSSVAGITGVMIDIDGLPGMLTTADFAFATGNDDTPNAWPTLAVAPTLEVRPDAGANGADRILLTWPAGTIVDTWLEVRVLKGANTGLSSDDVFYFGNTPGETGDNPNDTLVNATDFMGSRTNVANFLNPAAIDNPYDFNRDGRVNAIDMLIVRDHATLLGDSLELISPATPLQKRSDVVTPVEQHVSTKTISNLNGEPAARNDSNAIANDAIDLLLATIAIENELPDELETEMQSLDEATLDELFAIQ